MKYKITASFLILFELAFNQISAQPNDEFTVYCTGNHDATGSCLKISNSDKPEEFECIMVPGNIIDCKNNSDANIECILITATSAQAEFSCSESISKSLKAAETMSNQDVNYQDGLSSGGKTFDINNEQDDTNSNIFTDPF